MNYLKLNLYNNFNNIELANILFYSNNKIYKETKDGEFNFMEEETRYNKILEHIKNDGEKRALEIVYTRTGSIDRTLVYMFNKFKNHMYVKLIEDDNIKKELADTIKDRNSDIYCRIICSIKDDNLKANSLDKITDPYIIGVIISSIYDDSIKIRCLIEHKDKLHYDYEMIITNIIKSIKDEKLRLKVMYDFCEEEYKEYGADYNMGGFIEIGAPEIIAMVDSDEEKIEIFNKLQKLYNNSLDIGSIVKSVKSDALKLKILNENISNISNPENIICMLSSDDLKIEQMMKFRDIINVRFDVIINSLSTDELKIEQYELYKDLLNPYVRSSIIGSLKDDKLKENMANQFLQEIDPIYIRSTEISNIVAEKEILIGDDDFFKIEEDKVIVPHNLLIYDKGQTTYNFDYFNNEFSGEYLRDLFLKYEPEEIRDFFAFSKTLGCFSTDKLLDDNNIEKDVTIGQKATSLLAQLLKTYELKMRTLSRIF